ncbi:hypothetical protein KY362_01955 [Candidatus Woesearchaeota archaeon]|nr:hypothetical protein [Candidatus Woesearchaeota archaeon]
MDETTKNQLKELQRALQRSNPAWSQDKARWVATRMVTVPARQDGWH